MLTGQAGKAAQFRSLHQSLHQGSVLVLPNAWDAASAALIEDAGAAAIATTSAGVSWAAGSPDGQEMSRQAMVAAVSAITGAVTVPVSADIEGGYGPAPDDVAATVRAVIEAGAVGINLEDSPGPAGAALTDAGTQASRIAAARAAARSCDIDLFINARTDVFLKSVGDPGGRLAEVRERSKAYADAGADGLFVPGLTDLAAISELCGGPLPLNVMAGPGAPPVGELAAAGVTRVSVGSAIAQAAYELASRAATELLTSGTYRSLASAVDYGRLNSLLTAR